MRFAYTHTHTKIAFSLQNFVSFFVSCSLFLVPGTLNSCTHNVKLRHRIIITTYSSRLLLVGCCQHTQTHRSRSLVNEDRADWIPLCIHYVVITARNERGRVECAARRSNSKQIDTQGSFCAVFIGADVTWHEVIYFYAKWVMCACASWAGLSSRARSIIVFACTLCRRKYC